MSPHYLGKCESSNLLQISNENANTRACKHNAILTVVFVDEICSTFETLHTDKTRSVSPCPHVLSASTY